MKVFIGSSSESIEGANWLFTCLKGFGHDPVPWDELFLPGGFTFDSLLNASQSVDAAIFVFAEDDKIESRGREGYQTRDNVLIEYGLFVRQLGPDKAIIARNGSPKQASDLAGITYLDISKGKRKQAKRRLKQWLTKLRSMQSEMLNKIDFYRLQIEVYCYVFNRLNPYDDIPVSLHFLKNLSNRTPFAKIDDVLDALESLIRHYVLLLIDPDMRVYFAYKLIESVQTIIEVSAGSQRVQREVIEAHYRVGVSFSRNQDEKDWNEGLPIGLNSNVDRTYKRASISPVKDASHLGDHDSEQNQPVMNERSVIALPVLYSDDTNKTECIGVVGISSPQKIRATEEVYWTLARELTPLFSALFHAYVHPLLTLVTPGRDAVQIRKEIAEYYDTRLPPLKSVSVRSP